MKKSQLKKIIKEEVIEAIKTSPMLRESWGLVESKSSDNWTIKPESGKFRAVSPSGAKSKDLFDTEAEVQDHIDAVVLQYGPQNEGSKNIGYVENIIRTQTNDELKEMIRELPLAKPRDWQTFLKIATSEAKERNISESMEWEQVKCSNCKKDTDNIDIFPGGLCPDCYEKKMSKVPTHMLGKPDFVGAIKEDLKYTTDRVPPPGVKYKASFQHVNAYSNDAEKASQKLDASPKDKELLKKAYEAHKKAFEIADIGWEEVAEYHRLEAQQYEKMLKK